jgi:hypothetical protein
MRIREIENNIAQLRDQLRTHELYQRLNSINDVRLFMESHVFAVWDFMSLLKALQSTLTSVKVPWTPKNDASMARFVNEIVLAEESDLDAEGKPKSHFEMYLEAMRQIGANTTKIENFIEHIRKDQALNQSLKTCRLDQNVEDFVNFTFEVIDSGESHMIASSFTFGREDVIPDMFIEILRGADPENKDFNKLKYYLERHIELDGDEHGPLSLQMIERLCGEDDQKWSEALMVAKKSLEKRLLLWDSISSRLKNEKETLTEANQN